MHRLVRRLASALIPALLILSPGPIRPSDPVKILVFPPENLSKISSLAWIGEGLAAALCSEMAVPGVNVIGRAERIQLVESADLPPRASLSRASMIRVGQIASANLVVMGTYSGTADKLRVILNAFDLRTMKLSGDVATDGPLAALADMENELAWNLLSNAGLSTGYSREKFKERTRTIPNPAYSYYVRSLEASKESDQFNLLDEAVSAYREFPDAQFLLGRYYFEGGQCAKAIEHLELGRTANQPYVRGDFMLGNCYLEGNSLPEAIRCYSSLLEFARPIEALNNLGVAYLRKGDDALAVQSLLEARKQDETNSTVVVNLAIVRHLQANAAAARPPLEEALRAHPGNGLLHFMLGIVLLSLGDEEGAAGAFAKAQSLQIDVERLRGESPRLWSLTFTELDHGP